MILHLDHSIWWNCGTQIHRLIDFLMIQILEKNKALIDPAPKLRLSVQMALTRLRAKKEIGSAWVKRVKSDEVI